MSDADIWIERYDEWCIEHDGEHPYTGEDEVTRYRLIHFIRDGLMVPNYGWNRKRKRTEAKDISDEFQATLSDDEKYLLSHVMSIEGLVGFGSREDPTLRTVQERLRLLEGVRRVVSSPYPSTHVEDCVVALVARWRSQCRDVRLEPNPIIDPQQPPSDEGVAFLIGMLARAEDVRGKLAKELDDTQEEAREAAAREYVRRLSFTSDPSAQASTTDHQPVEDKPGDQSITHIWGQYLIDGPTPPRHWPVDPSNVVPPELREHRSRIVQLVRELADLFDGSELEAAIALEKWRKEQGVDVPKLGDSLRGMDRKARSEILSSGSGLE